MAKQENKRCLHVYANWQGIEAHILMGALYSERLKGKEIFSFEYNKKWLAYDQAQLLDPELQLYAGLQHLGTNHKNYGLF